jgi:uncharacterized protein (DUF1501 family)
MTSRRHFLSTAFGGFGALALAGLAAGQPHFKPRARRVIFLFMDGGMSHLDTFDPKPRLRAEHGQRFPLKREATQFDSFGAVFGSPWEFLESGQAGLPISDLFPHLRTQADELCVIRSMTSKSAVHASANFWLHTGTNLLGRPSIGSWVTYALGSEAENLPGFVVLNSGVIPTGGVDNFKSGFLPASYEGSIFQRGDEPLLNLTPHGSAATQARKLALLAAQDRGLLARIGPAPAIEAAMKNYELAAAMQTAVPELARLEGESAATKAAYGLDHANEHTRTYARNCLLARRLIERGVRFVEVTMPAVDKDNRWDAHAKLKDNHAKNALAIDQPIAALLADLRARGLLEDTLVVCASEFGRTPFSQGNDGGRDHNEFGFSLWLAGGGVKAGTTYGATDEYGYKAVEKPCDIHDLHATLLYLLGLDHEILTFRFGGRDHRLTDVHGRVLREVIA